MTPHSCGEFTWICRAHPHPGGSRGFLEERREAKRATLVDKLLGSDDYARHLAEVFDVVLLGRRGDRVEKRRKTNHWFEYLETAFKSEPSLEQIVRDLIISRPTKPERKGP